MKMKLPYLLLVAVFLLFAYASALPVHLEDVEVPVQIVDDSQDLTVEPQSRERRSILLAKAALLGGGLLAGKAALVGGGLLLGKSALLAGGLLGAKAVVGASVAKSALSNWHGNSGGYYVGGYVGNYGGGYRGNYGNTRVYEYYSPGYGYYY